MLFANIQLGITRQKIDIFSNGLLRWIGTSDVIGSCAFGIECNSLKDKNAEFITMGKLATEKSRHGAMARDLMRSYDNVSRLLRIKQLRDDVSNFFMNVVKVTVDHRTKDNIHRNDFMDILMSLKNINGNENVLSFNEVAAQVMLFFTAGFETSGITITNCLYELAQNLDVQVEAKNVIKKAYAKYDGKLTYEMMLDMPYIHQIIQETLRKYPVANTLNRRAKTNYAVNGSDQIIEKGTWIKIPIYAIHHDEEYYPDPQRFDPRRFDNDEVKKRHALAWIPFGDGPRGCIGMRFALMQIEVVLVTLLSHFKFQTCSKTIKSIVFHPKRDLLSPSETVYLKLNSIKL